MTALRLVRAMDAISRLPRSRPYSLSKNVPSLRIAEDREKATFQLACYLLGGSFLEASCRLDGKTASRCL